MHRTFWSAALAAVAVAAGAAPAHAGTVEVQFHTQALPPEPKGGSSGSISVYHLTYTAGAGEANDLTVTGTTADIVASPLGVRLSDTGAPLTAGQGCTAQGVEVVCAVSGMATIDRFAYDTGDGNDKLKFVNTRASSSWARATTRSRPSSRPRRDSRTPRSTAAPAPTA